MPLAQQDRLNNIVLVNDFVCTNFPALKNREDLVDVMIQSLDKHSISLFEYSGNLHRESLVRHIKQHILNNRFNAKDGGKLLADWVQSINQIEAAARRRYTHQLPERRTPSIAQQLRNSGYIKARHFLTHQDMQEAFSLIKNVSTLDAISLTDNDSVLEDALFENRDKAGELLIPINVHGNHWVLVNRIADKDGVRVMCWDPMFGPKETKDLPLAKKLQAIVTRVYDNAAKTAYEFANEQRDGYSCGYRVVRKAFEIANVEHDYTKVSVENSENLSTSFIRLIAQEHSDLKNSVPSLCVTDNQKFIYRNDDSFASRDELFQAIQKGKETQEKMDHYLAVVLQDIYCKSPDISEHEAMAKANNEIDRISYHALVQKEKAVMNWVQDYFNQKHPVTKFPQACAQDAKDVDQFKDDSIACGV